MTATLADVWLKGVGTAVAVTTIGSSVTDGSPVLVCSWASTPEPATHSPIQTTSQRLIGRVSLSQSNVINIMRSEITAASG
jgi:hypothetical protein